MAQPGTYRLLRRAVGTPPIEIDDDRKKRELDDVTLKNLKLGNLAKFVSTMHQINPNWTQDTQLRLETEELLKATMFGRAVHRTVSVRQVANEMGLSLNHGQLIKAGASVARLYRNTHGHDPVKHVQISEGVERSVNTYAEVDKELIVAALKNLD